MNEVDRLISEYKTAYGQGAPKRPILMTAPKGRKQPKQRSLATSLLPAAGAIGAGLIAAPFTGGLSLVPTLAALAAAGAIGGGGGELLAQNQNQEDIDWGRIAGEAGMSGIFSAGGAALSGARGLRAAKAAGMTGSALKDAASQTARGTLKVKDISRLGANGTSRLTKSSQSLKGRGIGALDLKEELRAIPNAAQRVATAEQYGIQSGFKGLKQATNQMAKFENELRPLLTKTNIPVKNVTSILDDVANTTSADVAEATLKRSIGSAKKAISVASKDGVINADELRTIRSKLGKDIFSGATTASKELKQDIYRAYGDIIGKASPKARSILGEQHKILDLGAGLAKRSQPVSVPIPLTGTRMPVPGVAPIRDRLTDALAGVSGATGGITGAAGRRGLGTQATRQLLPRALMNYGSRPEEGLTDEEAIDPTNPDLLGAEPGYPEDPTMSQGQLPSGESIPQQTQSQYPLEAALADIQRDPKHRTDYIAIYKMVADAEADARKAGGGDLTAAQKNKLTETQGLKQSVGLLIDNFQRAGAGRGASGIPSALLGRTPGVRSLGLAPQAQQFEDQRKALIAPLARAISGEVGVLTDKDISRAEGLLPRLSDPQEVAQKKIEDLLYLIEQSGGGGGTDDLVQALTQSQYQEAPQYLGGY